MNTPTSVGTTLYLKQTFDAPREDVFRAWTEPERLRQWITPPDTSCPDAEIDLRVGGSYRIAMKRGDLLAYAIGTYLEVRPPERLIFTWSWEPILASVLDTGESRVQVDFHERGASTEVVLTHERLLTEEIREFHHFGWSTGLDQLARLL